MISKEDAIQYLIHTKLTINERTCMYCCGSIEPKFYSWINIENDILSLCLKYHCNKCNTDVIETLCQTSNMQLTDTDKRYIVNLSIDTTI